MQIIRSFITFVTALGLFIVHLKLRNVQGSICLTFTADKTGLDRYPVPGWRSQPPSPWWGVEVKMITPPNSKTKRDRKERD